MLCSCLKVCNNTPACSDLFQFVKNTWSILFIFKDALEGKSSVVLQLQMDHSKLLNG